MTLRCILPFVRVLLNASPGGGQQRPRAPQCCPKDTQERPSWAQERPSAAEEARPRGPQSCETAVQEHLHSKKPKPQFFMTGQHFLRVLQALEVSFKGQVESKLRLEASLEGQVALGVRLGGPS